MQSEQLLPSPIRLIPKKHPEVRWDYAELQAASAGRLLSRPRTEVCVRNSTPAKLHSTTFDFPTTPLGARGGESWGRMPITIRPRKSASPCENQKTSVSLRLDTSVAKRVSSGQRANTTRSPCKLYSPRRNFPVTHGVKKLPTSPYEFRRISTPRNWLSSKRIATINLGCKLPDFENEDLNDAFTENFAPTTSRKDTEPIPKKADKQASKATQKSPPKTESLKVEPPKKTPLEKISPLVKSLSRPLQKLRKSKPIREDDVFSVSSWKVQSPRN